MKRREFLQIASGALVLTAIDGKQLLFGSPEKLQAANKEFISMYGFRTVEFPYIIKPYAKFIEPGTTLKYPNQLLHEAGFSSIRIHVPVDESGNFKVSLTEIGKSAKALIRTEVGRLQIERDLQLIVDGLASGEEEIGFDLANGQGV